LTYFRVKKYFPFSAEEEGKTLKNFIHLQKSHKEALYILF